MSARVSFYKRLKRTHSVFATFYQYIARAAYDTDRSYKLVIKSSKAIELKSNE